MDRIFDMLNDAEMNPDQYKTSEVSKHEKKVILQGVRKQTLGAGHRKRRGYVAAAVIIMCAMLFSAFMGEAVLAGMEILGARIEDIIRFSSGSPEDYKTVVGKEVTQNDITVLLNEVLLDDNQLIISSTFISEEIEWDERVCAFPEVFINGRDVMEKGGGGGTLVKKLNASACNQFAFVNTNNIDQGLEGDLRIKVVFDRIRIDQGKEIKGKWSFEFTTNKDALAARTKTVPIGRRLTLDSGQEITIDNLRISPVSTTLHYTMTGGNTYDMHFIVTDQNGQELPVNSGQTMTEHSFFRYSVLEEGITRLHITPYLISGYEGDKKTDFKKILKEEAFMVDIK